MAWDFATESEFERELAWIRALVRDEIEPLETLGLDRPAFERVIAPLRERVKERGLWAAHLGPELGGAGFGQVKLALMNEIIGRSYLAPPVFGNGPPDSGNTEILALNGSAEQRARYLEPLLAGELRSAFAMTEPGAGADPTLLETTARRDGDDYVIDGAKWFISYADIADFLLVMAVTDPDAPPRRRASILIVDKDTPGLVLERPIGSMHDPDPSPAAIMTHWSVRFDRCRVPARRLLGEQGGGFTIAQQRLGPGRIHHCMRWLGQGARALDMLCERATYRYSHGGLLGEKQTIQNWIADSGAALHAARLMTLHTAWLIDNHGTRAARKEISMIKYFVATAMYDVIDRALQAHGSLGYSTDMPLEEMFRLARSAPIYDGPDEVHRSTVARLTLAGYEPPPSGVPSEHVPTRRAAARRRFAHLLATG